MNLLNHITFVVRIICEAIKDKSELKHLLKRSDKPNSKVLGRLVVLILQNKKEMTNETAKVLVWSCILRAV